MLKITVPLTDPLLVMVCRIFPVPEDANPEMAGDDPVAVQLKIADGLEELNWMLVVCPEQIAGVVEVIMISGNGLTVTVSC